MFDSGKLDHISWVDHTLESTSTLNAELGRFCPFSAPRGHTFSTCPPRFPLRVFHGQIFTPDKHKVSAPNAPHPKVIQIIRH